MSLALARGVRTLCNTVAQLRFCLMFLDGSTGMLAQPAILERSRWRASQLAALKNEGRCRFARARPLKSISLFAQVIDGFCMEYDMSPILFLGLISWPDV